MNWNNIIAQLMTAVLIAMGVLLIAMTADANHPHGAIHREEVQLAQEGDYIAAIFAAIPPDAVIALVSVLIGVALVSKGGIRRFFSKNAGEEAGKNPDGVITSDRFEFVVERLTETIKEGEQRVSDAIKQSEERTNKGIARIEKRIDDLEAENKREHEIMDKRITSLRECVVKLGTKLE